MITIKAPDASQLPASKTSSAEANPSPAPVVTLEELAKELELSPRDARMLLRLAAKQKGLYPNLGKDHVPRQPWQWAHGSKGLAEAKKALAPA